MDNPRINRARKFPAYTLEQLEQAVATPRTYPFPDDADYAAVRKRTHELMVQEIAARRAGVSKPFKTPQIP